MFVHEGAGVVNSLINNLPFELHLPGGYQYCGPGTKLQKRLARGDPGINPLDVACKEHDIAYSQTTSLDDRHRADKVLQERAWQRVKATDAGFGERAAALFVTGAMKTKRSFGMGMKRRRCGKGCKQVNFRQGIVGKIAKSLKPTPTLKKAAIAALKAARYFVKQAGGRHRVKVPRVIPFGSNNKSGGFLPLIPLFAGLSALGALSGGAAGIATSVINARNKQKKLDEQVRHNRAMEESIGKGLYLRKNGKGGFGLHLKQQQQKKGKGAGLYLKRQQKNR